jgi:NADPH2 dehydrogenase
VAPSAIPHTPGDRPPHALTGDEIDGVVADFEAAARRAAAAGFDTVEIHAAHGYLLHEFLSPVANHRDDEYGGSLENRMRLPLRVATAVREAFPRELPVGIRISATDWVEGGWTLDESVVLARELRALDLDWVDCSSGGVSVAQEMTVGPGYQVPFAERVRRDAGIATIAVGLITDPTEAEAIVAAGKADLVALARGVLWDPRWGWHAAAALGATSVAPPQYLRAHASLTQAG